MTATYNSKIDWFVPATVVLTLATAFLGPAIDGGLFIPGCVIAAVFCSLEIIMFSSVKYQICDGRLGIRNFRFRWEWFPVDKITEARKTRGILSAPALSFDRVSIRFSGRNILKSAMPLEISPDDRDGFIALSKEINPEIKT